MTAQLVCLAAALVPTAVSATNFLVVLLDDVGVDRIGAYAEAPDPGRTPTIDALAQRGVLFRNAWVNPTCSPTRAALLTGLRAEKTGVGIGLPPGPGLDPEQRTIADVLSARGYATAVIGKWHLGKPRNVLASGFDTHRGPRANLGRGGYREWHKFVDGVDQGVQTSYATSDTADDAVAWIEEQTGPWFLWLAFNAPHLPFHEPPAELHSYGDLDDVEESTLYKATLEALDRELARVLESAGTETTVIVMGDNGTFERAIEPPFDPSHGKQSLYEGGVNVPLIVAGATVAADNRGAESGALVQATDLFATLAELSGDDAQTTDSVSFASQLADAKAAGRSWVYTSRFEPNGGPPEEGSYSRAARGARFKLIRWSAQERELYDLANDPHEQRDLLLAPLGEAAEQALSELSGVIDSQEWDARNTQNRAAWAALAVAAVIALFVAIRRRRSRTVA